MDKETKAKELLTWYFRLASQGPWQWTGDNQAGVESIIDLIVNAVVQRMKEEQASQPQIAWRRFAIPELIARLEQLSDDGYKTLSREEIEEAVFSEL